MSDAMSYAAMVQRASIRLEHARKLLAEALEETHDAAFGQPAWVLDDINETLAPFWICVREALPRKGT